MAIYLTVLFAGAADLANLTIGERTWLSRITWFRGALFQECTGL